MCVTRRRAPKTRGWTNGGNLQSLEASLSMEGCSHHPRTRGRQPHLERCRMKGRQYVETMFSERGEDGESVVERYLLLLDTSNAPGAEGLTPASHLATHAVITDIVAGSSVDVGRAMNLLRDARRRAQLRDLGARALSQDAVKVLNRVASTDCSAASAAVRSATKH